MKSCNPAIIPRNHHVERAIQAALEGEGSEYMDEMIETLSHPYDDLPADSPWIKPPRPGEKVLQTFCGT
jgi:uncharacterized protein YdiU (UPF0061 family)